VFFWIHCKLDTEENNPHTYTSIHGFATPKNIKRIMYVAAFAVILVAGFNLITSARNNNNKPIIIHVHPHLNLTIDGKSVTVPAQIGIAPSLWKDHSLDQYGMQVMNMFMPSMAPLRTLNNSGIIIVDSSGNRSYTLQNFLNIWGIDMKHKNVAISVDGKPITDYKDYVLRNGAKLNMTVDGKSVTIPAQIGINPSLWKDHSLDQYGMNAMNMVMSGMAPLHTHDTSGTIHVESNANRNYTLGEFLDNWGLNLNGKTVKATVDGMPVPDYKNIILRDGEQINLDARN
jgi:hypothetical protein